MGLNPIATMVAGAGLEPTYRGLQPLAVTAAKPSCAVIVTSSGEKQPKSGFIGSRTFVANYR